MNDEAEDESTRGQLEQAAARAVDLDALPKALSEDEREALLDSPVTYTEAIRALALIDALTALVAEQAAQLVTDGQRIAELEASNRMMNANNEGLRDVRERLEAKVRELEASMSMQEKTMREDYSRAAETLIAERALLRTAVGLLTRCKSPLFRDPYEGGLYLDVSEFLTGQPAACSESNHDGHRDSATPCPGCDESAAPSRTEAEPCEWGQHCPACREERGENARTEAEQAVLDASAALSTDSLRAFGKPASTPWVKFAHAELARRGLK